MLQLVPTAQMDEATRRQMRVSRKRFRLARLLHSTEEILSLAQQGDWDAVEKLEKLRQLELAACFSEADNDDSKEVIEALAALVHMNREITRLVGQAKQDLVKRQHADERRQQIARSYQSTDRHIPD